MPRIMARVWLQEPDGLQPVLLFDPAHPALQALEAARTQRHPDPRQTPLAWPQPWRTPDGLRPPLGHSSSGTSAPVSGPTSCSPPTESAGASPDYREDLVLANDFRHGFLRHFRDHSTASSDNLQAKTWFLCSPEARFVQHYDF